MERAIFLGVNALGDTLCTTPTIRAFRKQHPDAHITYITQHANFTKVLDHNPDIDLILYSEFLYLHGLTNYHHEWLYTLPLKLNFNSTLYVFDINQVCTTNEAFESHISMGFSRLLSIPIESVRPVINVIPQEEKQAANIVDQPYAVISMNTNANVKRKDGRGNAKDWPPDRWLKICYYLRSKGIKNIISIGSEFDVRSPSQDWTNMYGLPIKVVAALLKNASCVITLENGIGHLSHAVDASMVMIYSNILPLGWANPSEATTCKIFYGDPHLLSCEEMIAALDVILEGANKKKISI